MALPFSDLARGTHLIPFPLTVAPSGGWSWFSDPRAVSSGGKTFFGYAADLNGDQSLEVRSYDHATGLVSGPFVLHTTGANSEDHGPPTLVRRASDGRFVTFYHNSDAETVIYTRLSTNPDDVSAWGAQTDITSQVGAGVHYFFNPMQLTGETSQPIYLFYTGYASSEPRLVGFSKSLDGGATWAANTSIYVCTNTWAYFKAVPNGTSRIDFIVTDNHPDVGPTNVYHFYYQGGQYFKSDGTLITAALPFDQSQFTKIWDGSSVPGWIWDIAIDPATHLPIAVFATFPSSGGHRYQYAKWTGTAWSTHQVCTAGGALYAGQPHYSGGVVLDHEDPSIVYASRNVTGQWEMWKFHTPDGGATWEGSALTRNSPQPQIRPTAVRNHASDLRALWLSGSYVNYNSYDQGIVGTSC